MLSVYKRKRCMGGNNSEIKRMILDALNITGMTI
jgi:hypothetical protein